MSSLLKNPEEIHVFAVLYPAPGKMQRLKEMMDDHINFVHANEDYTTRYLMTEQADGDEPVVLMFETYISSDASGEHTKTTNFTDLLSDFKKENIYSKPPYVVTTKTVGGYDLDRQKVEIR